MDVHIPLFLHRHTIRTARCGLFLLLCGLCVVCVCVCVGYDCEPCKKASWADRDAVSLGQTRVGRAQGTVYWYRGPANRADTDTSAPPDEYNESICAGRCRLATITVETKNFLLSIFSNYWKWMFIYTVRQKERNQFSSVCIFLILDENWWFFFAHINENVSYYSMYLIFACIKNFV